MVFGGFWYLAGLLRFLRVVVYAFLGCIRSGGWRSFLVGLIDFGEFSGWVW